MHCLFACVRACKHDFVEGHSEGEADNCCMYYEVGEERVQCEAGLTSLHHGMRMWLVVEAGVEENKCWLWGRSAMMSLVARKVV